jgi:5-methylcytosine-specific restriction protein A
MAKSRTIETLSREEFLVGLKEMSLTDAQTSMLRVHFSAPNATITAPQMARQMGYSGFGAANLHYGRLGHSFAAQLGVKVEWGVLSLVTMSWPSRECEWTMRPEVRWALTALKIVNSISDWSASNDEADQYGSLAEGTVYFIGVNAFERNAEARRRCIRYHGSDCCVCGFSFGNVYGEIADGFIHVHHLKPLSGIGVRYKVDPVADLRPVCPNCHAIIHLRTPPYSIEEVASMVR